jgi:DedD protein
MMDRRLKERLVGATILVALIVLVVPELLSGPKRPGAAPPAAGLPAAPTRTVSVDLATNRATTEPDAAAASQAAPTPAPNPTPDAPASRRAGESGAGSANGAGNPNGVSSANGAGSATSTAAPPREGGESAPASTVATLGAQTGVQPSLETPATTPKSSATNRSIAGPAEIAAAPQRVWAVQLGSFASKANALRLAHQLQASGGSFYVSPGGSGPALRYRVRMGPLADRGAAERAQAKLKAQGHPATIVTPAS